MPLDKPPRPRNPVPPIDRLKAAGKDLLEDVVKGVAYGLLAAAILVPAVSEFKKEYARQIEAKRPKTPESKEPPRFDAQEKIAPPVVSPHTKAPLEKPRVELRQMDQALIERVRGIPSLLSLPADELNRKAPALGTLLGGRSAKEKCDEIAKILKSPVHLDDILTISIFLSKSSAHITNETLRKNFEYQRQQVLNMTSEQIGTSPDEAKRRVLADIQSSKSYKTITGGCNKLLMFAFGGMLEGKIQENRSKVPNIVDEILKGVQAGDEEAIRALVALGRIQEALVRGQ